MFASEMVPYVDELIRAMDPAMHKRMMKYAPIFLLHTEYVVHPISDVLTCITGLCSFFLLLKGPLRRSVGRRFGAIVGLQCCSPLVALVEPGTLERVFNVIAKD